MDLTSTVALSDPAALAPSVQGAIQADSHVTGPMDDLSLDTKLTGEIGTTGFPRAPVNAANQAHGLPNAPAGTIAAQATLEGAPLELAASLERQTNGAMHLAIAKADWKSAHADGDVTLPAGATVPQGHVALRMTRLDQLRPFLGPSISGAVTMTAQIDAQNEAHIRIDTKGIAPTDDIAARRWPRGRHGLAARRHQQRCAGQCVGAPNMPAKRHVSALQADYQTQRWRCSRPRICLRRGLTVDRLRMGMRQAVLELAGRLSPTLDLTANPGPAGRARRVSPPPIRRRRVAGGCADYRPHRAAVRHRQALRHRIAFAQRPRRRLAAGHDHRQRNAGGRTRKLVQCGPAPASSAWLASRRCGAGALDLRTGGMVDLTLLDPLLGAGGRRARGQIALDGGVTAPSRLPR